MTTSWRRTVFSTAASGLLLLAALRIPMSPQGAVPMSRPGQEDLTFWVNHNGLEQLDALGEVGFGDMARILLRRRSNDESIRTLRDRFTFKVREMSALRAPDVFRAEFTDSGLEWSAKPDRLVLAASHTFNLPVIVENRTAVVARIAAQFTGSATHSEFADTELPAHAAGGYFLRVVESQPGSQTGRLVLRANGRELPADVTSDVRAMAHLHVDLLDDDGRPAAARVYLTGADGLAYTPRGSATRIAAMSAEYYFHAETSFDIDLPAGDTLLEAARGPEYELTRQTVTLAPGRRASERLRLRRWVNMAARGWYSADAHIHANYTADHHQVIGLADVRLQAHGEDLNNANMMVANSSGAFLHDIQYFEGKPNALSEPNYILYWNEEMRNSGVYGHMSFFQLKSLVYPLYTGFRNTPYAEDYPANYTQAEAAHNQGAAVDYVHPGMAPNFENLGGAGAHELPVDLALGQVDAMDVVSNNDEIASMALWYRLLNCGFRLAISAGTDSFTNVTDHYSPGGGRVYVHAGNVLDYSEWVRNYKRGRSFASNGPVILLTVDGKEPGGDLEFPAPRKVRVKATLLTAMPVDGFEIVVNGKPAISRPAHGKRELEIDEDLSLKGSAWIAARAIGPWHRMVLDDIQTFCHTSPVYVTVAGRRLAVREDAQFYDEWIGKLIDQVNARGRFSDPKHKDEVLALFRRGREVYRNLAAAAHR